MEGCEAHRLLYKFIYPVCEDGLIFLVVTHPLIVARAGHAHPRMRTEQRHVSFPLLQERARTHKRPRRTTLSTAWHRDELQLTVASMCVGRESSVGRPNGWLPLASSFRRCNRRMMLSQQR